MDPYEAIRNLGFTPTYRIKTRAGGYPVDETFATKEEAEARRRELGGGAIKILENYAPDESALQAGGFGTKYDGNGFNLRPDGSIELTLQQPGAHKYDTMQARYTQDPESGQWTLQNDPMESQTRQQSSSSQMGQALGTGAAFFAAPTLGPALSGALGGGILGGAGAGAIIGGGGALAGGANSDEALRGALTGGVIGGVTGGVSDYMQGGTKTMPGLSDFDLSPRPGIDMASLPQTVGSTMPQMPAQFAGGLFSPIDIGGLPQPVSMPTVPNLPAMGEGLLPALNNTVPTQQDANTIEIVGSKQPQALPTDPLPMSPLTVGQPSTPGILPELAELNPQVPDVPAGPQMPGNGFLDWMMKNPQLTGMVAGGLLGAVDGGPTGGGAEPYTGPMPTIERGQWKPNAQANMMQVPQFGGLLPKTGQANSGLWRFGS